MKRIPLYAAAALLCAMVAACSSLGLTPATSLSERLAYAHSTNTALRTAADNALNAGTLRSADAEDALEVTDRTRSLLDASHLALPGGDPSTAEGRLVL